MHAPTCYKGTSSLIPDPLRSSHPGIFLLRSHSSFHLSFHPFSHFYLDFFLHFFHFFLHFFPSFFHFSMTYQILLFLLKKSENLCEFEKKTNHFFFNLKLIQKCQHSRARSKSFTTEEATMLLFPV